MHLDEAMKFEAARLDREIAEIDRQIDRLSKNIIKYQALRKKKEHDLKALLESFVPTEADETLADILKGKVAASK
jgi:hypothetical protein